MYTCYISTLLYSYENKIHCLDNYSSVYLSRYYSRVLIFLNDTGYLSYHGVDI